MRRIVFLIALCVEGCGGWSQDATLHRHYCYINDRMIGVKSDTTRACKSSPELKVCKKIIIDNEHYETVSEHVSPYSRYQGVCKTIFKHRRSDDVIVGWRFEGRKEDCLEMP